MSGFGISGEGALGVPVPAIRALARELRPAGKTDPEGVHLLALALWSTGVHEARMLAAFIDVPALVTREQVEAWACDLDSWDVCDQLCGNLLDRTTFAWELCEEWAGRPETFGMAGSSELLWPRPGRRRRGRRLSTGRAP